MDDSFTLTASILSTAVYADYIGGQRANYRKWYFAGQLDLDNAVHHTQNLGLQHLRSKHGSSRNDSEKSSTRALERWPQAMNNMSQYVHMRQIAVYRLSPMLERSSASPIHAWVPPFFQCTDDYY